MERTVAVKTDQDNVKIAVITQQNKIMPSDDTNLQLEADINMEQQAAFKEK